MKKFAAAILAVGLMGTGIAVTTAPASARPAVGIRIGDVGIGVGHRYHHRSHWYGHRSYHGGHYRYW
jgi:hypothetical protein